MSKKKNNKKKNKKKHVCPHCGSIIPKKSDGYCYTCKREVY